MRPWQNWRSFLFPGSEPSDDIRSGDCFTDHHATLAQGSQVLYGFLKPYKPALVLTICPRFCLHSPAEIATISQDQHITASDWLYSYTLSQIYPLNELKMRRVHLFEFTDLAWYPQTFRDIQTDYLQFVTTRGSGHKNLVPLFARALGSAGTTEIVDLCSGGTGPWLRLREQLRQAGVPVTIKLTDKYPHPEAARKWAEASQHGIEYIIEPVDALNVPPHLTGMRTLFEGFHHFQPEQASAILKDAVDKGVAIGIFEASLKPVLGWLFLLLSPLMTLLGYVFTTPFVTPRTCSRFLWTYLLPIVPLTTRWDGVISFLRVYSFEELNALTDPLECDSYTWESGQVPSGTPIFNYVYLIGYPEK